MILKRTLYTTRVCLDRVIKTSKDRKAHFENVNSWQSDSNNTTHILSNREPRLPKKKVALLLGFNGSEYQGMQA
jgi:tRNA pseudouridine38-40 synthase